MRRATPSVPSLPTVIAEISIHALREESDIRLRVLNLTDTISIHALREESDLKYNFIANVLKLFQSTLSVRRATPVVITLINNPDISIHALREESDPVIQPMR